MLGYSSYGDRRSYATRGAKRYDSDMIARAWRNQETPNGKCPSSMSFEGRKFYSYATVIAEIIELDGRTAYLVSDEKYSSTTARHLSEVRGVLHSRENVFTVPGVPTGSSNLADFPRIMNAWKEDAERKLAEADKAQREIKRSRLIVEAYDIVCKMRELAQFYHEPLDAYAVKLPIPSKTVVGEDVYTRIIAMRLTEPSPWMRLPHHGTAQEQAESEDTEQPKAQPLPRDLRAMDAILNLFDEPEGEAA